MQTNTTTNTTALPVMRSRARLKEWKLNPRQGAYDDIEELMESLSRVGQQDAIHVWETPDADLILKGHRRNAAMDEMGWKECLQVVHRFETEEEAYLYLLQDHGHTVSLDAAEKIVATENALGMGIAVGDVADAMGVNKERVQLWFAFGTTLPASAKRALAEGNLSMNTAELLLKVTKEDMADAVAAVLRDEATGTAMSHGQAMAFIESKYLRPAQWRMEWLTLEAKLKKKLLVIDGYTFVAWEQRMDYVQGETGQPWADYQFADGYMPRVPGKTWGQRAEELGVVRYVVPAPRHEDKHVILVSEKMMRAAESVQPELPRDEGEEEKMSGGEEVTAVEKEGETGRPGAAEKEREDLARRMKVCLGAIWEELAEHPAKSMTSSPWEALLPFLCHLVTDVDAGALEAWMGPMTAADLLAKVQADTRQRAPLRWALVLLLCAASDAADKPEVVMREVAEGLGIERGGQDQRTASTTP